MKRREFLHIVGGLAIAPLSAGVLSCDTLTTIGTQKDCPRFPENPVLGQFFSEGDDTYICVDPDHPYWFKLHKTQVETVQSTTHGVKVKTGSCDFEMDWIPINGKS